MVTTAALTTPSVETATDASTSGGESVDARRVAAKGCGQFFWFHPQNYAYIYYSIPLAIPQLRCGEQLQGDK